MTLIINGTYEHLSPDTLTVGELAGIKGITTAGTAIAVNGRLVKASNWDTVSLKDGDSLTIISAAYGG